MRRIILALLLVFPLLGYGQTAKYILDGNDDVKIEFFNSTNISVISNAVSSNSSAFKNSLELGQSNNVNFRSVRVSSSVWDSITIDPEFGIQIGGGAAARTRTNLSLGWNVLTNTNPFFFRAGAEIGETNQVYFKQVTVGDTYSIGTNGVIGLTPSDTVKISSGGIFFESALPLEAGTLTPAANVTRTNLGLGWSALTNTNEFSFRRDIGIGVTNSVDFRSVTAGNQGTGVTISSNGITFNVGGPLAPGELPVTANTTRTNLGLGAPWLTNTDKMFFRLGVGLGETNTVNFKSVTVGDGYSISTNGSLSVVSSDGITISSSGISFNSAGVQSPGIVTTTALNTRKNLGFSTNLNTFWSATNTAELQTALFNSSSLNAQGQRITNLAAPVNDNDAATRAYVFGLFSRVAPSVSFGNTTGTVEVGSTVMSVSLSWLISPTNTPVASQSISASQGTFNAINTTSRATTAFIPGPQGFPNQPFTSDVTWTLTVNDGTGLPGATVTAQTSIAFRHYMSWGIASTTSLDNSQIRNLHTNTPAGAGREFRDGKGKSVNISGNGQYIYFAYPASFGAASFIVNNAPNTAWISNTVTYTNSSGNSSQFLIYRSTDVQFGTSIPITIN